MADERCDNYTEGDCLSWKSTTPCEKCKARERAQYARCRALIEPHYDRLYTDMRPLRRDHSPLGLVVQVPRDWPAGFGPGSTIFGLDIVRGDVEQPEVTTR